jgi:hypothetical protein
MQNDFFKRNLKAAALATLPVLLFVILYHIFKPEHAPVAWRNEQLEFLLILLVPVALARQNWDRTIQPFHDRLVWCLLVTGGLTLIWWLMISFALAMLLSTVH